MLVRLLNCSMGVVRSRNGAVFLQKVEAPLPMCFDDRLECMNDDVLHAPEVPCAISSSVASTQDDNASAAFINFNRSNESTKSRSGNKRKNSIILARNVFGVVKSFNPIKHFGFIIPYDASYEVFVHANATPMPLVRGQEVQFDVVKNVQDNHLFAARVLPMPSHGCTRNAHDCGGMEEVSPALASNFPPSDSATNHRKALHEGRIIAHSVGGRVSSFDIVSGYGFITRSDNCEDVFVGYRDIRARNPSHFVRSLQPGEAVVFDVFQEAASGDRRAVSVTGPDGQPVQGHDRADGPIAMKILSGHFRKKRALNDFRAMKQYQRDLDNVISD